MSQIFILDDSVSMERHWHQLTVLYRDLIYLVKKKKLDPNGSQLRFITSNHKDERKDTTLLVEAVRNVRRQIEGTTNFAGRIDAILEEYLNSLRKNAKTRPISIYVLTNGVWEKHRGIKSDKDHHLQQVANVLARAVATLDKLSATENKIGIQFIRFGNDEVGKSRLKYLDAQIQRHRGLSRDICDTTPANGNVWKMMLGSIDSAWDDDPDDGEDNIDDTDDEAS